MSLIWKHRTWVLCSQNSRACAFVCNCAHLYVSAWYEALYILLGKWVDPSLWFTQKDDKIIIDSRTLSAAPWIITYLVRLAQSPQKQPLVRYSERVVQWHICHETQRESAPPADARNYLQPFMLQLHPTGCHVTVFIAALVHMRWAGEQEADSCLKQLGGGGQRELGFLGWGGYINK